MPRLGHKKSRNGCLQCKKRRVKCDEGRPCKHCSRHGVECSLLSDIAHRPSRPNLRDGSNSQERSSVSTPSLPSHPPEITEYPVHMDSSLIRHEIPDAAWQRDLELLHHFCFSTSYTFNPAPEIQSIYRDEWPKIGFAYKPVLHGILAVSAMHLAHTYPDRRDEHVLVSAHHQNHAISQFRLELPRVTQSNIAALFTLSIVISICQMAALPCESPSRTVSAIDDTAELLALSKGILQVFQPARNWLRGKPLGLLTSIRLPAQQDSNVSSSGSSTMANTPSIPDSLSASHWALEDVINKIASMVTDTALIPSASERAILITSLDALSLCFRLLAHGHRPLDPGIILTFPVNSSPELTDMIYQRHPAALVMLSNWAAVAHSFSAFWWVGMRGKRVVSDVTTIVTDPKWRPWLEWPEAYIAEEDVVGKQDFTW